MNFVGANQIKLESTKSTNNALKDLALNTPLPEGTLLITREQTNGKGQLNTNWNSEPGANFTGTYYFKPKWLTSSDAYLLNFISALAVSETVQELAKVKTSIKWPNDVLVDQKKIAGILVENKFQGQYLTESFIGIGLNINQTEFPNFQRTATSVKKLTNKTLELESVQNILSIHLQQFYMLLKTKGSKPIIQLYLEQLYLLNQWNWFNYKNEKVELKIIGIAENGLLQLQNRTLQNIQVDVKEIQYFI